VPHGVLDVKRRLTNIFVGLLGSINDFSVFWKYGLYRKINIGGQNAHKGATNITLH
jgi:hypothetical protein